MRHSGRIVIGQEKIMYFDWLVLNHLWSNSKVEGPMLAPRKRKKYEYGFGIPCPSQEADKKDVWIFGWTSWVFDNSFQ